MIPATHWHDNGDGTAWWLLPDLMPILTDFGKPPLDHPCGTCGGTRRHLLQGGFASTDCNCIDGRHTFDIEVEEYEPGYSPVFVRRVSIVPGMVLSIVERDGSIDIPGRIITYHVTSGIMGSIVSTWIWDGRKAIESVTLPSAAAPGMWAVKVKVGS